MGISRHPATQQQRFSNRLIKLHAAPVAITNYLALKLQHQWRYFRKSNLIGRTGRRPSKPSTNPMSRAQVAVAKTCAID
jgi:hypothetical protein